MNDNRYAQSNCVEIGATPVNRGAHEGLESIERSLATLDIRLAALNERLNPVLVRPDEEFAAPIEPKAPCEQSELAQRLAALSRRLDTQTAFVEYLLKKLDV